MWAGAAELPLWIIVNDDDYAATGDVCIAADWSKTSRTRFIPVFSSERAARRYMAKANAAFAGCRPLSLRTIESVVAAIDIAESKGIDHVVSKEIDHRYIILASIHHVGGYAESKGIDHGGLNCGSQGQLVSIEDRLAILQQLAAAGYIDEVEFRQRKLSIINEIDELVSIDAFRRSLRQQ